MIVLRFRLVVYIFSLIRLIVKALLHTIVMMIYNILKRFSRRAQIILKDIQMYHYAHLLIFSFVLVLFPGCVKYHKIFKSEFPQGVEQKEPSAVAGEHLRSCAIYDQFQTLALFDVVWFSDKLKTTYVDMVCKRHGKDNEAREALLRRQLEENKHWITFAFLADIRDKTHVAMSEKDSAWSLYLQLEDGEKVQPVSIKEVELEPEYQIFFGSRFNLFKKAYMIKFPAKPLDGKPYMDRGKTFKMTIASTKKAATVEWSINAKNSEARVKFHEDIYWV